MNSLAQDWFRTLTSGLILADMIGQFCRSDTDTAGINAEPWPQTWLAIAHCLGRGDISGIAHQQPNLQRLEAADPTVAVLGAMPLVLTTPEIMVLAKRQLALRENTWALLGYLQARLWSTDQIKTPPEVPLLLPIMPPIAREPGGDSTIDRWVQPLEAVCQSCLGQFAVAVEYLLRRGDNRLLPWVGLLTAAHGLEQLPLSWRHQFLQGAGLQSRWQLEDESSAWRLADELYYRWIGRLP